MPFGKKKRGGIGRKDTKKRAAEKKLRKNGQLEKKKNEATERSVTNGRDVEKKLKKNEECERRKSEGEKMSKFICSKLITKLFHIVIYGSNINRCVASFYGDCCMLSPVHWYQHSYPAQ